jgi:Ca-activated chloride channel family protein
MPDAVANRRAVATALERRNVGQGDRPQGRPGGQPQPGAGQPKADPGSAQGSASAAGQGTPPPAPAQQAQADAAQREAMERALQQAARAPAGGASGPQATPQERERRLSNEAALRRIPDEPGNLLREKFRLEHERRQREGRAP